MNTVDLGLQEIYDLALSTLKFNGCDNMNAEAVAATGDGGAAEAVAATASGGNVSWPRWRE